MSRIIAPQRIARSGKMGMLTNPNYFESMSSQRRQATVDDPMPTPSEIFEEHIWPTVDEMCLPIAEESLRKATEDEEKAKDTTITITSTSTLQKSEEWIAVSSTAIGLKRMSLEDSVSYASPSTQCSLPPGSPQGVFLPHSVQSSPTYRKQKKEELDRLYNSALSINTEATTDDHVVMDKQVSPSDSEVVENYIYMI